MGEAYLAEDTSLGREVALEVLPREMATKSGPLRDNPRFQELLSRL